MKTFFTLSIVALFTSAAWSQPLDARATVKTTGSTAEAWIRAETAVTFPLAQNVVAINLAFSLPANGETNPAMAPAFSNATTPLAGLAINSSIPVEVNFDRFIYTIILTGNVASMAQWDPNTEHKVLSIMFGPETNGDFPRLDNWLNTGGGAGQGYFYFEVGGIQRSDTEGDPFYNGVEGTYPSTDAYVESTSALPISLLSFDAQKFGEKSSLLQWITASESNSSHFVVQRSTNKKTWSTLGHVDAAGQSQDLRSYEFVDENVYNGTDNRLSVYYRLQMVDNDGQSRNSPMANVIFGKDGLSFTREFLIYPNPASDGVQVEWETEAGDQPTSLEIYDVTGKLVFTQDVADNSNQEYIDFGFANIKSGMYLLRIMSGDRAIEHKQIVVGQNR